MYKKTNHYENSIAEYKKLMKLSHKKINNANFGTSFASYAFDWKDNGVNFAIAPQTLHYDLKLLRKYEGRFNESTNVYITLTPVIFLIQDFKEEYVNTKYYGILGKKEIINYSFVKYLRCYLFPVLRARDNWKYVFKDEKKKSKCPNKKMTDEEAKELSRKAMHYWCEELGLKYGEYEEVPNHIRDIIPKTTGILKDMIDVCFEKKITPYIVKMPVCPFLKKEFTSEFMKNFFDPILDEIGNEKSFILIDFLNDSDFANNELFMNPYLLNVDGQKLFMNKIKGVEKNVGK